MKRYVHLRSYLCLAFACGLALAQAPKDDDAKGKAERFCAIGEDWLAQGDKEKAFDYAQEALRLVSGLERARKLYEACRGK